MFRSFEGLLGASAKFSSSCSELDEEAADVVVDGGKLKRLVAGKDALWPTCAAGDGDLDARPLPRQGSCSRSIGVAE